MTFPSGLHELLHPFPIFLTKYKERGMAREICTIPHSFNHHRASWDHSYGDTPSEGHGTGYSIIYLNAGVYVRVQQHHVRECFVTLSLAEQVYLPSD